MSRFNTEAYDKLFPRVEDPAPDVESAVEGFEHVTNDKPIEVVPADPEPKQDTVKTDPLPEPVVDQDTSQDDTGGGADGV